MEKKWAKDIKIQEDNDPVLRLQGMIDKKTHNAKIQLKQGVMKQKQRYLASNFKTETTKEDVESFLGKSYTLSKIGCLTFVCRAS